METQWERRRWTLTCGLRLPWRPLVDLSGETDYLLGTFPLRIICHTERWSISGVQALVQLATPAAARVERHVAEATQAAEGDRREG
jgi:hypothetical protein